MSTYINNRGLVLPDPRDIINGIRHIVGYTVKQYGSESSSDAQAAIDRRIRRLVLEALKRSGGFIDLNRTHEKYYFAIERAFKDYPQEIQISACYHMEHNGGDNRSGLMEPFIIESYSHSRNGLSHEMIGIMRGQNIKSSA